MVLTRLSRIPLSNLKYWKQPRLNVSSTRQLSSLCDQRVRKKGRKIVKRIADLPSVYISENGVAATPLPEWNPTYIVPLPDPGWFLVYVESSRLRRCRLSGRRTETQTQGSKKEG